MAKHFYTFFFAVLLVADWCDYAAAVALKQRNGVEGMFSRAMKRNQYVNKYLIPRKLEVCTDWICTKYREPLRGQTDTCLHDRGCGPCILEEISTTGKCTDLPPPPPPAPVCEQIPCDSDPNICNDTGCGICSAGEQVCLPPICDIKPCYADDDECYEKWGCAPCNGETGTCTDFPPPPL